MSTLTNLAPDLYKAADIVARELTGFLPSVSLNAGTERVAKNQTIRSHVTPAVSTGNRTPAMTIPEGTNQNVGNESLTMSNDKSVEIPWTGEEVMFTSSGGIYRSILGDQFEQAFRAHVNEWEAAIWTACLQGASRAYGTAGTTPFGTAGDFQDATNATKILKDNGAGTANQNLVIDTTAGAKLLGLQSRFDIAGDTRMQEQGIIVNKAGMAIRESAQVSSQTKGTGAGYLVNNVAGYAVGDTTIAADTGAGTILAGDVVTFAGDTNKYVVTTALAGGSFTIGKPGLRAALADNTAITVGNTATSNIALRRDAVEFAVRPPAQPEGGDAAVDVMIVQDPRTGLAFEIRVYKGYGKVMFSIAAVWAVKVWKQDFVAILLG